MNAAADREDDAKTSESLTTRERIALVRDVLSFAPMRVAGVVVLALVVAVLEGLGLSFLLPIVDQASNGSITTASDGRFIGYFADAYAVVGVPFTLETVLVGAAVVLATRFGLAVVLRWERARQAAEYTRALKTDVFAGTLAANVSYLDEEGTEDLINAVVTQANYPANALSALTKIAEKVLMALVYLGVMLALAPVLTIASVLVLGVVTLGIKRVLRPAYGTGSAVAVANREMQAAAQAGIMGAKDVKLFGGDEAVVSRFADSVDDSARAMVQLRRDEAVVTNLQQFAALGVILALVYFSVVRSLSLGSLGVFLFAMLRTAPVISSLNGLLFHLSGQLPHVARTQRSLAELRDAHEPRGGDSVPETVETVEFDDVHFSYPDGTPALRGCSLVARRGEFVAVVGGSGAGKSTLVSLLARLHEPDAGRVIADGVSVDEFDLTEWRERLGVVRQDPYMFTDTLRANVTVGAADATDDEVRQACDDAGVGDFLESLPNGLDTQIGSSGVRLSGGQRQRVAIARALCRRTPVLVLDEATSNLDAALEADLYRTLDGLSDGRTLLAITHRLTTATHADRIYVMDGGRVVEVGTHEELLDAGGRYATLYETQVNAPVTTVATDGAGADAEEEPDAVDERDADAEEEPDAVDETRR